MITVTVPDCGECRASISGFCLQVTMGTGICAENECIEGDWNDVWRRKADEKEEP